MGYSVSAKADFVLKEAMKIIGDHESCNVFRGCFFERGRENSDGAFTAQVYKFTDKTCLNAIRSGSIRIEANGTITRFPTMKKLEKLQAVNLGLTKFKTAYGE